LDESDLPAGWHEQPPQEWRRALIASLGQISAALPPGTRVTAISADSTSGTILPVDRMGTPLMAAMMYNDRRSEAEVPAIRAAAGDHQRKHGYAFASSFGLPKIRWIQQQRPDLYARTHCFLHAADYLLGCLSGCFETTDSSNALKSGYDLVDLCWPAFIETRLGIPVARLPQVVLPGTQIGTLSAQAAAETGLPEGAAIIAGATDGTAAQLASGAVQPGDWNTTLGTTLVFKGIAPTLVPDPQGRVYSHRHPEGWWMPGGASNTGGEWIPRDYPQAKPGDLDAQAAPYLPTSLVRYPLCKRGERFPFINGAAEEFLLGTPTCVQETYAAGLEGAALIERLAYDTLRQLGLPVGERIYITGGGARSALWSQVRAAVLGKVLVKATVPDAAMGAALLAAAGCWYPTVSAAAREMVKIAETFEPRPDWQAVYDERYAQMTAELKRRGYMA
jgi:xylulokinase